MDLGAKAVDLVAMAEAGVVAATAVSVQRECCALGRCQ